MTSLPETGRVGEPEQRRQDRRGRMAAHRIAHVVEVERVRRRAVDQRGIERVGPARRAEDYRLAAIRRQHAGDDACARLGAARQGDADPVEDADLGGVHCRIGQVVEPQRGDAGRQFERERHGVFLRVVPWAAWPALVPASRPNTAPETRPVPLG
jgi:hypothetical protein